MMVLLTMMIDEVPPIDLPVAFLHNVVPTYYVSQLLLHVHFGFLLVSSPNLFVASSHLSVFYQVTSEERSGSGCCHVIVCGG